MNLKKILITISIILSLSLLIVVGYLLYNQTNNLNAQVTSLKSDLDLKTSELSALRESQPRTVVYTDAERKIQFSYPSDWKVDIKKEKDTQTLKNISNLYVTSPSGSQFIHYVATFVGSGFGIEDNGCNIKDPNGLVGDHGCVFVTGVNLKFARYNPLILDGSGSGTGKFDMSAWYVLQEDSKLKGTYPISPFDNFSYIVKSPDDLVLLDGIMKSVKRL